jgi:type IV secretory pathway protease TraF
MTPLTAGALFAAIISAAAATVLALRHHCDPLQPFLSAQTTTGSELLPAGHLGVLGDNKAASMDSREWGLIPVANVLAKVVRTLS